MVTKATECGETRWSVWAIQMILALLSPFYFSHNNQLPTKFCEAEILCFLKKIHIQSLGVNSLYLLNFCISRFRFFFSFKFKLFKHLMHFAIKLRTQFFNEKIRNNNENRSTIIAKILNEITDLVKIYYIKLAVASIEWCFRYECLDCFGW